MSEFEWAKRYWYPVAWAAEVHETPVPVTLLGSRLVVWRANGNILASYDRCPHRGTALSLGEVDDDGCLVCPYHGWLYDQSGACVHIPQMAAGVPIPPRARLTMVRCEDRHGLVWVCLDQPVEPIPEFPEYGDVGYRHVPCPTYRWATSPGRMVENFTDFGHLGYLHDGLLGTKDDLVVPAHKVDQNGGALTYTLSMQVPNTNEQFTVTDVRGERGLQTNRYVLTLPFTIHLACTYEDTGSHRTLFFSVQPHGDGTCTGYCYQSRDFELEGDDNDYAKFQELLAEQDRPIVESQLPAELPLGSTDELQLPFDRVAIAYRRALADLAGTTSDRAGGRHHAAEASGPVGGRTEYPNYVEARS
jgi:phenylpropionate dioxygenase-like ring-hydroxylating dioxygenase large terminal subunit